MPLNYDSINLKVTSSAGDAAKGIDKATKSLNQTATASQNAAKGMSEVDKYMKAAQLESKRLSAELAQVNADINSQQRAFKSQNQQVQQSFSSIQTVFSAFSGTLSKPLIALQRLAQAQDQLRQTSALSGMEAQRAAIQQQQASLQRVQYTIAQQQAEAGLVEQQRTAQAAEKSASESRKLSWAEANQQLKELKGEQAGFINMTRNGQTVFEALADAQREAGIAGEEAAAGVENVANSTETLQEKTNSLSESFSNLSQYTTQIQGMQADIAQGFLSTAQAQQTAIATTGGLSQAAIGLNVALGPLQPILLAIAAVLKAVEIGANITRKAFENVRNIISSIVDVGKRLISTLKKVVTTVQNVASAIGNAVAGAASYLRNLVNITDQSKKSQSATDALSKTLRKAWNVLQIKVLRNAINALFQRTSEGFQQLALDSQVFNQSMSAGVSSVRSVSNALVAALAPAINAVIPLLVTLANAIRTVLNLFAALSAAVFGQASFFVANDVWEDYAAGASGAAGAIKDVNDAVNRLNFDELTTIADINDKSGGGGGGGGGGDWFTEMETPNWADLFESAYDWAYDLTTVFLDWLSNINWTEVRQKAYQVGQFFGNIVSGAIDAWFEYEDPRVVGRSIAQFLNLALEAVSGYLDVLEVVDGSGLNRFQKLGHQIGENIDEAVKTFDWGLFSRDLTGLINGAIDIAASAAASLVNNDTFYQLGFSLFNSLGSVLRDLKWDDIGDVIVGGFTSAIRWVQGVIDGWNNAQVGLGTNLANLFMRVIRETPWDEVAAALSDGVLLVLRELNDFIAGLSVADIVAAIQTFLSNIKWEEIKGELKTLWDGVWEILLELPEALDIPWLGQLLDTLRQKFEGIPGVIQRITDVLSNVDWATVLDLVTLAALVLAAVLAVNLVTGVLGVVAGFLLLYPVIELIYDIFLAVRGIVDLVKSVFYLLTGRTDEASESFSRVLRSVENILLPFGALRDAVSWLGDTFGSTTEETKAASDAAKDYEGEITRAGKSTSAATTEIAESAESGFRRSTTAAQTFSTNLQEYIGTAYLNANESVNGFELNTNTVYSNLDEGTSSYSNNISGYVSNAYADMGVDASQYETLSAKLLKDSYLEYVGTYADITETVTDSLDEIGETTETTYEGITETVTNAHGDILEDLGDTIGAADTDLQNFRNDIENGIIDPLTAAWKQHGYVFEGIVDDMARAYKGATNLMIGYTNAMMSGVTAGVNVLIDAINALRVDVPDWVPDIGGRSFQPSLSHVSGGSIPMLARGGVIKPNDPFLAIMGDQRSGTNIEAPLATIQEALADVITGKAYTGGVHVGSANASYRAMTYTAGGVANAATSGGADAAALTAAVSNALQQNAYLFEQPTLVVADEQVGKANSNYQNSRGVSLGGAFASVR